MKSSTLFVTIILTSFLFVNCKQNHPDKTINIVFLHHSTGRLLWIGKPTSKLAKFILNKSNRAANLVGVKAELPQLIQDYNKGNNVNYNITEQVFPKSSPYGWNNYPFDYYNIWVKNAGDEPFMEEPTLEILTKDYDVIIFKHCFPVSNIEADVDSASIDSNKQTLANYKLQYAALKEKLHSFPKTKFILFTPTALVKNATNEEEALRANEFYNWILQEWDTDNDNIHLWDFRQLQTEGGLYFKQEYASGIKDSHPNEDFAQIAVNKLFHRLIDIIENDGQKTLLTGDDQ